MRFFCSNKVIWLARHAQRPRSLSGDGRILWHCRDRAPYVRSRDRAGSSPICWTGRLKPVAPRAPASPATVTQRTYLAQEVRTGPPASKKPASRRKRTHESDTRRRREQWRLAQAEVKRLGGSGRSTAHSRRPLWYTHSHPTPHNVDCIATQRRRTSPVGVAH
jgi:hypothetical protein